MKTNETMIRKEWTTKQLAEALIVKQNKPVTDYDIEDEPYLDFEEVYITSDGREYYDELQALDHEIWWLKQDTRITSPEKQMVSFVTEWEWLPGEDACWTECPFQKLLKWGESCEGRDDHSKCPFLNGKCKWEN